MIATTIISSMRVNPLCNARMRSFSYRYRPSRGPLLLQQVLCQIFLTPRRREAIEDKMLGAADASLYYPAPVAKRPRLIKSLKISGPERVLRGLRRNRQGWHQGRIGPGGRSDASRLGPTNCGDRSSSWPLRLIAPTAPG